MYNPYILVLTLRNTQHLAKLISCTSSRVYYYYLTENAGEIHTENYHTERQAHIKCDLYYENTLYWAYFLHLFACTGIRLVDETNPQELQADENLGGRLVTGVKAAYSIPAPATAASEAGTNEVDTSGVSLDDLMAQMKAMWNMHYHVQMSSKLISQRVKEY